MWDGVVTFKLIWGCYRKNTLPIQIYLVKGEFYFHVTKYKFIHQFGGISATFIKSYKHPPFTPPKPQVTTGHHKSEDVTIKKKNVLTESLALSYATLSRPDVGPKDSLCYGRFSYLRWTLMHIFVQSEIPILWAWGKPAMSFIRNENISIYNLHKLASHFNRLTDKN